MRKFVDSVRSALDIDQLRALGVVRVEFTDWHVSLFYTNEQDADLALIVVQRGVTDEHCLVRAFSLHNDKSWEISDSRDLCELRRLMDVIRGMTGKYRSTPEPLRGEGHIG